MERIGVRELRQHASRYLARVATGETLEVTDRGRPVALLVPVRGDEWLALLAGGRVSPPADDSDILDEAPSDYGFDASGRLTAMRDDER
ncbi:MAG: type II toxin-antitoxin system prevent-host-death family antitoxin [Candidatus Nephthysia bennettiae]|nr:MAG: type II toxin-antitoxin system prevent-host-death family antitoxin [Candidatus Dormibacteraeota bacterium]